jgi:energy-coupling factor transport system ATP-binding protein
MNILVDDVTFTYLGGVRALDQVNVEIPSGQCVAIVGENGAGKTTLVKLFNGLLQPDLGEVWVGDWNTTDHNTAELAARVGFLFQNPDDQLFERSVFREVAFGPRNLGLQDGELDLRVRNALQKVGLSELGEINPYDLPFTGRKLVALAATLAMDTPILVLDEITIGQDAAQRSNIGDIVENLKGSRRTVILISHDLDFCAIHAERVIVMADGRVLDDGPAEQVLARDQLLERAAVHPPQLVRLAQALGMPRYPLMIDDFVVAYRDWRKERRMK